MVLRPRWLLATLLLTPSTALLLVASLLLAVLSRLLVASLLATLLSALPTTLPLLPLADEVLALGFAELFRAASLAMAALVSLAALTAGLGEVLASLVSASALFLLYPFLALLAGLVLPLGFAELLRAPGLPVSSLLFVPTVGLSTLGVTLSLSSLVRTRISTLGVLVCSLACRLSVESRFVPVSTAVGVVVSHLYSGCRVAAEAVVRLTVSGLWILPV